ncbi:MAG: hypothetical protein KatS3mg023_0687 [Armatimonadota bacterium]|nr:MAG: hypothetical protein KatS3mg023_0687 [Armatimonadota bacterium]
MRMWQSVYIKNPTEEQKQFLQSLPKRGKKLRWHCTDYGEGEFGGVDCFVDIADDHPQFEQLIEKLLQWGDLESGRAYAEFDPEELDSAQYLNLNMIEHGYPQPEDDFAYIKITYDLSDYCEECGIGRKQKAPFRLAGEPRCRAEIFTVLWEHDPVFVRPRVWEAVFAPRGFRCLPVLNRRGQELQSVVQVVIEEEVGLDTTGLYGRQCWECGRLKFMLRPEREERFVRYKLPVLVEKPVSGLAYTREWFGWGHGAHKLVVVSQEIYRALKEAKVDVYGFPLPVRFE